MKFQNVKCWNTFASNCVHSHPTGKKKKLSTRSSRSRNVTGLVLNETEETFDRCCFQFTRTLTRGAPVRNESSIRILLIRNRGASEGKQKEKENSSGKLALSFPSVRRTYQTSTQEFSISSFCLPGALVPLKPTAQPFQQRGVLPRIEMNHPAILSLSLSLSPPPAPLIFTGNSYRPIFSIQLRRLFAAISRNVCACIVCIIPRKIGRIDFIQSS